MIRKETVLIARAIIAVFPDLPRQQLDETINEALIDRDMTRADAQKRWKNANREKVRSYNRQWMRDKRAKGGE